jgi:type I restriction enzyme S subunit
VRRAEPRAGTVGDVLLGIETGKSVKTLGRPACSGELGILKVSAVTWGRFRPEENKAVVTGYEPGNCPRPRHGDILISRANTRELVGAPVLVERDHSSLLLSDKILRLVPNLDRVDRRFLAWALRSEPARAHFVARAGGTSGSMTNITQEDIRAAPLPLPPLAEQRRIADMLDKADAIRRKENDVTELTEELLYSAFLEMFGDPVANPKGWEVKLLGDLASEMRYGTSEKCGPECEVGLPVLRIPNVVRGIIDWAELKFSTLDEAESNRLKMQRGDLLFVRSNGNPGYIARCAVFDSERAALFASYLIRVRLQRDTVLPGFVQAVLSAKSYRAQLASQARTTAGNYNISTEGLRRLVIPLPPFELQEFYVRFATKVRANLRTMTAAGRYSALLFRGLMAQVFEREPVGE